MTEATGKAGTLPLKTPITFRASVQTIEAIAYIQTHIGVDKTAVIELAIARMAAWLTTGETYEQYRDSNSA